MKIVFTGGGTGGHFYPLIAVAEEINRLVLERHLIQPELYFAGPQPYDAALLYDQKIKFIKIPAGKFRRYFSILNIFDAIAMPFYVLKAFWKILWLYPDVVFSKGGYGSFPTLLAARFFRIPVIIHESDSVPGAVNRWSGRFAYRVALSYPEAQEYFPKATVAITGNPIRKDIQIAPHGTGKEFFGLDTALPTILILGGSQGSRTINEAVLDALPELVKKYTILHQTGSANFKEVTSRVKVVLEGSTNIDRYKAFETFKPLDLKMAAGAANIVISRAGSTLFEIASWHVPSIIIPIKDSNGDHQRKNAFAFARTGAGEVIEENNLTPHILVAEIEHIMGDPAKQEAMKAAGSQFGKPEAATLIAEALLGVALSHEK